ncbi:MAG: nicotinate-nucleotide adenylyltransferase [Lentisphaeria bacterium]|nr:nicotinate-nucleotide adenylyltransferase [Lentisphaeria bacterium]
MTDQDKNISFLSDIPAPKMTRIAVFGGTFDPVHNGHLSLASALLEADRADEVLFIPAGRPPHKTQGTHATPEQRLEMLNLAIEHHDAFAVSDIEVMRQGEPSYTIDTLIVLAEIYPDCQLQFLLGMDSLLELHKWHRVGDLVRRFDFVVFPRPGVRPPTQSDLAGKLGVRSAVKLLDSVATELPVFPVSSTEVRARCVKGLLIDEQCPVPVAQYIEERGLYKAPA